MQCKNCGCNAPDRAAFCPRCGVKLIEQKHEDAKCPVCGMELSAEQRFCPGCGTPVSKRAQEFKTETKPTARSHNRVKKTSILLIIMPIAIVLTAVLIYISFSGTSQRTAAITLFETGDSLVIPGDNNTKMELDEGLVKYSLDKSKAGILIGCSQEKGGELWYVTTNEKVKISDDVYNFVISGNGSTIIYNRGYDLGDRTADIYRYDASSNTKIKIDEDVFCSYAYDYVAYLPVSPDGRSIGYVKDVDMNKNQFNGYIKINGKEPEKLGLNSLCMAVSDNGEYIYYVKYNSDGKTGSFYVKHGDNITKLSDENTIGGESAIFLNEDYSQVIFNYDNKAYISKYGNEKDKIANFRVKDIAVPSGKNINYYGGSNGIYTTYGIKDFSDILAVTYNSNDGRSLVYINNKGESDTIAHKVSQYAVDEKGMEAFYIKDDSVLYKKDLADINGDDEKIAEDVTQFCINPGGSEIYFINKDKELYYVKDSGKPKKIADDVYKSSLCIDEAGDMAFYLVDYNENKREGELYYSRNGGARVKIADEVAQVKSLNRYVYYYTNNNIKNGTYDMYLSEGNGEFIKFLEDIAHTIY